MSNENKASGTANPSTGETELHAEIYKKDHGGLESFMTTQQIAFYDRCKAEREAREAGLTKNPDGSAFMTEEEMETLGAVLMEDLDVEELPESQVDPNAFAVEEGNEKEG